MSMIHSITCNFPRMGGYGLLARNYSSTAFSRALSHSKTSIAPYLSIVRRAHAQAHQSQQRIRRVVIANRGEIACRIIRTARRLGVETVALYSDADRNSLHVNMADYAYHIGPAPSLQSYLNADKIIEVTKKSGSQAIHPGYGFMSEKPEFADLCEKNGISFIGPPSSAIRDMGIKSTSKEIMERASVPVIPGYHGQDQSDALLKAEADKIGYPIMIKAVRGGGGKGMRVALSSAEFAEALGSARRESAKAFGDASVLLERYVVSPRHVEVQVFGDKHGNYVYMFERDCSLQRRHQKVIEEAPGPGIREEMRKKIGETAVLAARAVKYVSAGTVEFIVDPRTMEFFFMEMNTRLQVEHPVTEAITGLDLVEWQLRVANGEPLPKTQAQLGSPQGHAFEARIYAEDPSSNFMPGAGPLKYLSAPQTDLAAGIRLETGVRAGDEVSVHYDPMIAKLIVHARDRRSALELLDSSLARFHVIGLKTNVDFLRRIARNDAFAAGRVSTGFFEEHQAELLPSTTTSSSSKPANEELVLAGKALIAGLLAQVIQSKSTTLSNRGNSSPFADTNSFAFRVNHSYTKRQKVKLGKQEYDLEVVCEPENTFRVRVFSSTSTSDLGTSSKSKPAQKTQKTSSNSSSKSVAPLAEFTMQASLVELTPPSVAERGTAVPVLPSFELVTTQLGSKAASSAQVKTTQKVLFEQDTTYLLTSEGQFEFELPGLFSHYEATAAGDLSSSAAGAGTSASARSPMPGVVEKIFVKVGDSVALGQSLLVVIAMKTEYTIRAAQAGVVGNVRCKEGQAVPRGALLVEFKE